MNEQETPSPIPTNNDETKSSESMPNGLDISQKLITCEQQKEEWKNNFLRTAADFENFKKRTEKEKSQWMWQAQASVLGDLLSVVDNFERAFQTGKENTIQTGFELIYKELQKLLEKYGITQIVETNNFDPNLHEAVTQVESPNHKPEEIVQILQKGYMFKGHVLRPAKVSVAK